jgi:hypothetical protein
LKGNQENQVTNSQWKKTLKGVDTTHTVTKKLANTVFLSKLDESKVIQKESGTSWYVQKYYEARVDESTLPNELGF